MNKLLQGTNFKIKSNSDGKYNKHTSKKNKRFKKKQNSKTKTQIEFKERKKIPQKQGESKEKLWINKT